MKNLSDFKKFRELCLINAVSALKSAEILQRQSANHIAYHLCTLALEEIGKVFIAWFNFNRRQKNDGEISMLALDDHTKKIFWAFWWETFGKEIPTQQQMDSIRALASDVHQRRLQSLYTELTDTTPASEKILDEELENMIKLVQARLELAKADEISEREESEAMKKFMIFSNDPEKRQYIFSKESLNKMIELEDSNAWVEWLADKFDKEQIELDDLLKKELERTVEFSEAEEETAKWQIKVKINCPLHAIRPNILNEHNKTSPMFQLSKGVDKHTLIINVILNKHTAATTLWQYGYFVTRIYVTALNIAAGGVFWWHASVDLDKYYEAITDLESKKKVDATLITKLRWPESNHVLSLEQLQLTKMVYRYMLKCHNKPMFAPFLPYMHVLALMAKNDVHLRFETDMFMLLFNAFQDVIIKNEKTDPENNFKEVGYFQISGMYPNRDYYFEILELGESIIANSHPIKRPITLTEVLAIKQYISIYLLTLAVRDLKNDNTLRLTNLSNGDDSAANDE